MTKVLATSEKSEIINAYKVEEFNEFLKLIEEGNVENWTIVAQALGIDNDTVTKWKRDPRAKAAIANGLKRAVNNMELYGKKDWRMWREKAKMLGAVEIVKNEQTGEGGGPVQMQIEIVGQDRKRFDDDTTSNKELPGAAEDI